MTEPFTQTLSKPATFIAGVVVLVGGAGAALFAAAMGVAILRDVHAMHTTDLWVLVLVAGLFGVFAAVLLTSGYRLLFRSSAGAGSMLPRSLWLILSVVLGALAIFCLVVPVLLKQFHAPVLYSSIMMAAFSWWCYRFGRRGANDSQRGAASNNRWRGP